MRFMALHLLYGGQLQKRDASNEKTSRTTGLTPLRRSLYIKYNKYEKEISKGISQGVFLIFAELFAKPAYFRAYDPRSAENPDALRMG